MSTLYHGSYTTVESPRANAGRRNLDDQLRFKKPNHQLCIRNQEILDKHLHFASCYIIKDED